MKKALLSALMLVISVAFVTAVFAQSSGRQARNGSPSKGSCVSA